MEQKKMEIVDEMGRVLNRKPTIKDFMRKHIEIITSSIISIIVGTYNLFFLIDSRDYVRGCSRYYGIDKRYFDASNYMQDKKVTIVALLILVSYPLIFQYIKKQNNGKTRKIIDISIFVVTTVILFFQNITFLAVFFDRDEEIINNLMLIIILIVLNLLADVVIAYFLVFDKLLSKNTNKYKFMIFGIAIFFYITNLIFGINQVLKNDVSDKRKYELIDRNTVVVSVYDDKLICMDCEIENKNLKISRARYKFIDMDGVSVTYCEFDNVTCE